MLLKMSKGVGAAAFVAAAVICAAPAVAQQRLSLVERVDRLEQQQSNAQGSGGAVDLVNQISALQAQVQTLQGQVEELKHALDEAKQRNKDQYVDLDSRIGRLEGGGGSAPPVGAAARPIPRNDNPPDVDLGAPNTPPPRDARFAPHAGVSDLSDTDRAMAPPGDSANALVSPASGDPAAANAAYTNALDTLKAGNYSDSSRKFQTFIDQYPDSDLISNAHYWLGQSYYITGNYKFAQQAFDTLLRQYPQSPKAADALLKIGYCEYELKQWDRAQATFEEVQRTYPDSSEAKLAQGRLRALQMETRH